MPRCSWAGGSELLGAYHDTEWGLPVHDDRRLFEMLTLEGAQAGLSWETVLRKRERYRVVFDEFDPLCVAAYGEPKIVLLLDDPGIVRNRAKVRGTVTNAQRFLAVAREHGSFDAYLWGFVDGRPVRNRPRAPGDVPATSALSDAISRDLKERGFSFVGSTIVYAFLQAVGIVDDHLMGCPAKPKAR